MITKLASEIKTGDLLYFPNSHRPQEVTFVSTGDSDHVTIQAGADVRWVVPVDFSVNVEVESVSE